MGGASSRMGGAPKGLLPSPDGAPSLVARWRALFASQRIDAVLVGRADAYPGLGRALADEAGLQGPLAGVAALLAFAGDRTALSVACDMPFVTSSLVARLVATPCDAPVLAPRRDGRWEPFLARWNAPLALPTVRSRGRAGDGSLQRLFDALGARELPLDAAEATLLDDWDTPADLRSRR